jgi:hypothetical protein
MLLSAPPLAALLPNSAFPPKVELMMVTGSLLYWPSTRIAPPPSSEARSMARLLKNRRLMTFRRPERMKMAPPLGWSTSDVAISAALPSTNVRFCTVRCGESCSWQWVVHHPSSLLQAFEQQKPIICKGENHVLGSPSRFRKVTRDVAEDA